MNDISDAVPTETKTEAAKTPPPKKQAVILVHGMGEQVPMETLRGFVETMWIHNPDIDARASSLQPALLSQALDLTSPP